jgi:hypothetical protein
VARECAQGLLDAHRIAEGGIFRTLALGVRASRTASLARESVVRTITRLVGEIEEQGRLSIATPYHRRTAAVARAANARAGT